MNLFPLISLSFLVVGLRIASEGEMYVWLAPAWSCICVLVRNCGGSNLGMVDFSSINGGLPVEVDFVDEKVLGERSARGAIEELSFVGDIACTMVVARCFAGSVRTEDWGDVCVGRAAGLY